MTNTPALTPDQARRVQHAREIAAATAQTLAAQIGIGPGDTADQMYGYSFGLAQVTIGELLQVIEQLTGADDEDQDDDPEPAPYDPGPECDDQGGMSEYRYAITPEEPW